MLLFRAGNWQWVAKDAVSCFSKSKSDKYVQVFADNVVYETPESLVALQEYFCGSNWVNCFRAIFVNISQVEKFEKLPGGEGGWLIMKNTGKKIPVSRNYLDDVFLRLNADEQAATQKLPATKYIAI